MSVDYDRAARHVGLLVGANSDYIYELRLKSVYCMISFADEVL